MGFMLKVRVVVALLFVAVSLTGVTAQHLLARSARRSAPTTRATPATDTIALGQRRIDRLTACFRAGDPLEDLTDQLDLELQQGVFIGHSVPYVSDCPELTDMRHLPTAWPELGVALDRYLIARAALEAAVRRLNDDIVRKDPHLAVSLEAFPAAANAERHASFELVGLETKQVRAIHAEVEALIAPDPGRATDVRILRVTMASDGVLIALGHVQEVGAPAREQLAAASDAYVAAVAVLPTTQRAAAFRAQALTWQAMVLAAKQAPDEELIARAAEASESHGPLIAAFNAVGIYY